jgi:HAD superfamily hydrolase (TIGR01509 family)
MSGSRPDPVVLFDVDGTLTDTNYLHTLAWRRGFLDCGHEVASWRIHRMIGASGTRLMEDLIGRADEAVEEAWRSHFERLAPEIRAFPGARDLVDAVRERGGAAVLATSSPGDLLRPHLAALDLSEEDFTAVTTDSDVEEAKPAPDVFVTALEQAGGDRDRAIVIGDTGWDVEAATAAGVPTIAVCSGGWSRDELRAAGAIEVHDDAATLLARFDSSVLGDLLTG